MKKKMLIKKATTWTMVAAMTMSAAMTTACSGGGEEEKKGDDSSKGKSVSDVTFPLEEKLELDVFVYGTGGEPPIGKNHVPSKAIKARFYKEIHASKPKLMPALKS